MQETNIKKKNILKMSLLIVGLLILIGGTSYAAYNWVYTGGTANTISTTGIDLKFLESNTEIINITNALPMYDDEGINESSFDFAVTSKTTRDVKIKYTLNIQKLSLDSGYTALTDNQIKVYLTNYDNNQIVAPTLISDLNSYKLYTGIQTHNSSNETVQHKFKLRVWIDESLMVAARNWTTSTKLQYKFKIGITSEEKVSTPRTLPTIYRYGTQSAYNGTPLEAGTYTNDYTTLNKQYFLGYNLDTNNAPTESYACYILNSEVYCLKGADTNAYEDNIEILNESFGEENCSSYTKSWGTYYECSSGSLSAYANSRGSVNAYDDDSRCDVNDFGNSYCTARTSE